MSIEYCAVQGKVKYPHRREAAAALRQVLGRKKDQAAGMAIYECPDCGRWHYGHSKERPSRKVAAYRRIKKEEG